MTDRDRHRQTDRDIYRDRYRDRAEQRETKRDRQTDRQRQTGERSERNMLHPTSAFPVLFKKLLFVSGDWNRDPHREQKHQTGPHCCPFLCIVTLMVPG